MILDTNALSALAEGDDHLADALASTDVLAVPVIVLGEYEFGIAASRHRGRYRAWLDELVRASRVLVVDRATASEYATIRSELRSRGRPIPSNDAWIAALARQHGLVVVSRDAHFDEVVGVRRVAW